MVGLLAACAGSSATRLEAWRSDRALWTAAVRTTPTLARPAFNLAVVALQEGQWAEAERWLRHSLRMAEHDTPSQRDFLHYHARAAVSALAIWRDICGHPEVQPLCASPAP